MKILLILFLINFKLSAYIDPSYIIQNLKLVTPELYKDEFKPKNFSNTSNLIIKAGSPFQAKGVKKLIIIGNIFDLLGLPLSNVVIKFYHANAFGFYNYASDQLNFAEYDVDLVDTGKLISNNLGQYKIETIIPGTYDKRAPHIHMIIEYKNINFETQMFFYNHPANKKDKILQDLNKSIQNLLFCKPMKNDENSLTCQFNIRLNIIDKSHRL